MPGVEPAGGGEEQAVAGHRVVDAGAGQDQPVVAPERRDHDRQRHDAGPGAAEDRLQRGRGDPVVGRVLDGGERQRAEVGQVGQEVQDDHDAGAGRQRHRHVAVRVPDLRRHEGDVVPGHRGEQRTDLGDAERDEQPVDPGGRRAGRRGTAGPARSARRPEESTRTPSWRGACPPAPSTRPIAISARRLTSLVEVKTFWISLPSARPRVLVKVSSDDAGRSPRAAGSTGSRRSSTRGRRAE